MPLLVYGLRDGEEKLVIRRGDWARSLRLAAGRRIGRGSGMAMTHALRYREKARELYEAAVSASTEHGREQFAALARQYELLAIRIEMSVPEPPVPA